jgi:hypothetical protein
VGCGTWRRGARCVLQLVPTVGTAAGSAQRNALPQHPARWVAPCKTLHAACVTQRTTCCALHLACCVAHARWAAHAARCIVHLACSGKHGLCRATEGRVPSHGMPRMPCVPAGFRCPPAYAWRPQGCTRTQAAAAGPARVRQDSLRSREHEANDSCSGNSVRTPSVGHRPLPATRATATPAPAPHPRRAPYLVLSGFCANTATGALTRLRACANDNRVCRLVSRRCVVEHDTTKITVPGTRAARMPTRSDSAQLMPWESRMRLWRALSETELNCTNSCGIQCTRNHAFRVA